MNNDSNKELRSVGDRRGHKVNVAIATTMPTSQDKLMTYKLHRMFAVS